MRLVQRCGSSTRPSRTWSSRRVLLPPYSPESRSTVPDGSRSWKSSSAATSIRPGPSAGRTGVVSSSRVGPVAAAVHGGGRDEHGPLGPPRRASASSARAHPLDVRRAVGLLGPRPRGERDDDEAGAKVGQGRGLAVRSTERPRSGAGTLAALRRSASTSCPCSARRRPTADPRSPQPTSSTSEVTSEPYASHRGRRAPRVSPWAHDPHRCTSTTWWWGPAPWGWRSPTRSSTTPTPASRWSTGATAPAGTGWRPTRSSGCTSPRRSTASPRPCSAAAGSSSDGPEAGLQERATQPEIMRLLRPRARRLRDTGRVEFLPNSDYVGDRHGRLAHLGRAVRGPGAVPHRRRPLPRARASRPRRRRRSRSPRAPGCVPVNDLARLEEAPSQYVVVGSGKTATDACVWLLDRGVDPDAICWVRPRDPWMLNRALIQPDPAVFLGMAADLMESARRVGVARRPVPAAGGRRRHAAHRPRRCTPTMAKAPTLGDVGAGPAAHRSRTSYAAGTSGGVDRGRLDLRRRRGADRRRRPGRALRGRGPEVPAAGPDLAARGDHPAAGPGRLPVLRRRADRLRRGHPRPTTTEKNRLCPPSRLRQLDGRSGRR